jgi:hypothetical protein
LAAAAEKEFLDLPDAYQIGGGLDSRFRGNDEKTNVTAL